MFTPRQAALAVLISAFALGIAIGLLASKTGIGRSSATISKRQKFIDEIDRDVRLSATQRGRIRQILTDAEPQYREAIERCQPYLATIRKSTRDRIRSLLTPSQQFLFDQRSREMSEAKDPPKSESAIQPAR